MHSLGPPHQSQQFDGFHDRLANLHDEAVSTPPTTPGLAAAHSRPPPCPPHSSIHSNAGSPGWKLLISNPLTTDERTSLLTTIFSNRDEVRVIENLSGDDAQNFIDVTYEALDDLNHAPRVKCLRFLCKICGCQSLLPRSLVITASYDRTGVPLGHGGCADVWKGRSQGRDVAIKVLKMYQCSNHEQIRKEFCKEVLMWKALRHPNVLPLLGVMMINTQFAMVSEWMVNGNIKEFVKAHTSADRLELLLDVARGLDYLHGQEMIHGDLKGANILIDSEGHARIADFGLLTMISDSTNLISSISRVEGGTTQWMSPELLDPERFGLDDSRPTEESDCYALGMVVYEVLSGHSPFPGCKDPVVIRKVMDGERPEKPQAIQGTWFTDGLWEMLERCWEPRPDDRPSLKTIFRSLEGVARPLLPPSPTTTNEDTETDTDDMLDSPVTSPGPTVLLAGGHLSASPQDTPCSVTDTMQGGDGRIVREENQELTIPATPIHRLPTSAILHRIAHWDGSSQGMSQVLTTVFAAEDYLDCIRDLGKRNIDPQMYINSLDQIIDILPIYSGVRKLCIQALTETCILYQLLPTSYTFASRLSESSSTPFASGRHASVWKITNDEGAVFALRALCVYETDPVESYYKRLYTEVIIGRHVKHPNVLSVDGVAPELFRFCTVSKWMRKGDMLQYITTHPDVNRLSLLIGVTRGLEYLHGNEVVHGDLKSGNILIDEAGIPRLRDFGKSSWFTLRYCAPERPELGLKKQNATYESDVYSLSMVIVELATGQPPFPQVQDPEVYALVSKGKRPPKPHLFEAPGLTPDVWKIAETCWHKKPEERPKVHTVLQCLEELANRESVVRGVPRLGGLSILRQLRLGGGWVALGDGERQGDWYRNPH